MPTLGDLLWKVGVTGLNNFEADMGAVGKQINKVVGEADRSFRGFDALGSKLTSVGAGLSAGITLPLAAAGGAATKFAADFDLGMRQVTSLLGNVSQGEFKQLEEQTLELSKAIGIDAVDATHALYEAISAGVPKENALDFVRVASVAAIAGLTDTGVAVDALTTIIAAYGLETTDAKAVSDAMFQAVNVGKFTFEELASSIGPAAQQASNLGISYQELLAATSTLSITSGGVSIAVTQIESAMRALLAPTKEMQAALNKIGFESGSAAVKSLGLEGTLQKLRETTGGNAEAFNALFGRIEGANGALGLTGPKAAQAAKDFQTLKTASDGVGASQAALDQINQSTSRQFDILTNTLKNTAIQLGVALLPAVNDLLKNAMPLIQMLSSAVQWFTQLPQPVQTTALALVGVAAAVGPLTTLAGGAIQAFSGIASTFTTVSGLLERFPAMATAAGSAMSFLGQAALVAGAAFAGFKLGQWLAENVEWLGKFSQAFADFVVKVPGAQSVIDRFTGATAAQAAASENAAFILKKQEAALAAHGVIVDKAGKSQKEYADAVSAAVKELAKHTPAVTTSAKAVDTHTTATTKAKKSQDDLNKSLNAAESALSEVQKFYKLGQASAEDVKKAQDALTAAVKAAHPEWKATSMAVDGVSASVAKAMASITSLAGTFPPLVSEMDAAIFALGSMSDEVTSTIGVIDTGLNNIKLPAYGASDAFKQLGISSSADLKKVSDSVSAAYEAIKNDSNSTAGDVQAAWAKMMQAKIDYARSLGDDSTANALQKQLDAHVQHGKKVGDVWSSSLKQVSTIFTDFSKGIVDDLFSGDFSIGNSLEKLGKAFTRVFVEDAMSSVNTFVEKGIKWLMSNLDDLLAKIPGLGGIGSALGGILGTGASTAGTVAGTTASTAGTIASGTAGAAGSVGTSAAGSAGAFGMSAGLTASIGLVTSAISAVGSILQVFGVGQGGQKDRLNLIADATTFVAQMFGDRGVEDGLKNMINDVHNFVNGAFGGWYHDAYVGQLMTEEATQADIAVIKAAIDGPSGISGAISAIRDAAMNLPYLAQINTALSTQKPPLTINVTGYVGDRDALIGEIRRVFSQELALQGA